MSKKTPTSAHANLCINASCYSTRANMHEYCSMCIWFFNYFFSLLSVPNSQLPFSLRCTTLSFSHLINLSSSSFRRLPPPPIALSSFVSRCFRVEWAWLVGFGLNVSHHCHRLPLEASILFLVLTITTRGVDLIAQGEASIPVWYHFDPFCSRWGVDSGVGFDPFCWACFSGFLSVGCVDSGVILVWIVGVGKEMNVLFE